MFPPYLSADKDIVYIATQSQKEIESASKVQLNQLFVWRAWTRVLLLTSEKDKLQSSKFDAL